MKDNLTTDRFMVARSAMAPIVPLLLLVAGLLLMACGPATQLDQREVGTLPYAAQDDDPHPQPTETCDIVEYHDANDRLVTEEICSGQPAPTAVPVKYPKLQEHWDGAAQEAEELARSNRRRSDVDANAADAVAVDIYLDTDSTKAATTVAQWLKSRNVTAYDAIAASITCDTTTLVAEVPFLHLGPLSQLPEVMLIEPHNPGPPPPDEPGPQAATSADKNPQLSLLGVTMHLYMKIGK